MCPRAPRRDRDQWQGVGFLEHGHRPAEPLSTFGGLDRRSGQQLDFGRCRLKEGRMKVKYWLAAGCAAGMVLIASLDSQKASVLAGAIPDAAAHTQDWQYAQLPMAFERNQGQTDAK